jgi:hypothetical protein
MAILEINFLSIKSSENNLKADFVKLYIKSLNNLILVV